MLSTEVAIIVPTLGLREEYLFECLESIRLAGETHVVLVAPSTYDHTGLSNRGLIDECISDPGGGLAAAINHVALQLPTEIVYFNWLGDDDRLVPHSIELAVDALRSNDGDFVWGSCEYIDRNGATIGINRSGRWARALMRFGPDLIPQPGALYRRDLFVGLGGLDESYRLAFDYDLFMRFTKYGKSIFLNETLAQYRWHQDALSANSRRLSVLEARRVRRSYLPKLLRPVSFVWEYPTTSCTYVAGKLMNLLLRVRSLMKLRALDPGE